MPDLGILQTSGVQPTKPSRFSPISTQKFFTGLWTQRSPFTGPDNRYNTRFLGGRPDILIDGLNVELTNYNTYIRRPGCLPFCSGTAATPVLGFYGFHQLSSALNPITVIVDTATTVYTADPVAGLASILTKGAGASQSSFLGVGNTMYIGDGVDLVAYQPSQATAMRKWGIETPAFTTAGESGPETCTNGADVAVAGATAWSNPEYITGTSPGTDYATVTLTSTGNVSQTGPTSGSTPVVAQIGAPAWVNPGNIVASGAHSDATIHLTTLPSALMEATSLGFNIPLTATITGIIMSVQLHQTAGSQAVYGSYGLLGVAGTAVKTDAYPSGAWPTSALVTRTYGTSSDLWSGNIANLTPAAINSSSFGFSLQTIPTQTPGYTADAGVNIVTLQVYYTVPTANQSDLLEGTVFGFTATATQFCQGVQVTVNGFRDAGNTAGSFLTAQLLKNGTPVGNPVTFVLPATTPADVTIGGFSGLNNGGVWGVVATPADVSSTGFGVAIQSHLPGGGAATWSIDEVQMSVWLSGAPNITLDTTPGTFSATLGYSYVYCYGNPENSSDPTSVGHIGTASMPASIGSFTNATAIKLGVIACIDDPQVSQIWVFRTADGGSTYLGLPSNPYPNTDATVIDNAPDTSLVEEWQAPIDHANDPPPAGLISLEYHSGRVWGSVGNLLYCSAGPDCIMGNGSEAWPPGNVFVFPSNIHRNHATPNGMLVFTASDVHLMGGTSLATYYPVPFQQDMGLLSPNAIDFQGNQMFLYTADRQFTQLSAAGVTEHGFAIGNLLETNFNPSQVYVASLLNGTSDKAVFISDGSTGWYRCNWNQNPEGGPAWSPFAAITGGITAMAAIETSPGIHQLLFGQSNGAILARSINVFTDNGSTYTGYLTLGSIVLAQPGQLAEVESITLELMQTGTVPTVGVLLDEIAPASFETLSDYVSDPPMLPDSATVMSKRWYLLQGHQAILCRHMQTQISFIAEPYRNELLTFSIFGALQGRE